MSDTMQHELREFATELIERNGGLVDWPHELDWGQAILSPELAGQYGTDEVLRLSAQADGEGMCVSLASDFLDAAEHWLHAVPQFATVHVPDAYLKRGDIGEAVAKSFTWLNARVRVAASEAVPITYHTWWFHILLSSEDRWETQLATSINTRAAVEVDLPDPFQLWEVNAGDGTLDFEASYDSAITAAQRRIPSLAERFLARMDARLDRDRKRLKDYYNALRREAKQKSERGRTTVDPDQAGAADQAVSLELRRKLVELEERFAIDATLRPLAVVQTELPVLEVRLTVQRKQATREHVVFWNPLTKSFDPLRCSACGRGTYVLAFSNDRVDALCAQCS